LIFVYGTWHGEILQGVAVEFGEGQLSKRYWRLIKNHMNRCFCVNGCGHGLVLQWTTSNEATEFKNLLVKLRGKTVKRTKPCTSETLLSGLFGCYAF
jgi:hypothetical protein